jgi:hypothetical protein
MGIAPALEVIGAAPSDAQDAIPIGAKRNAVQRAPHVSGLPFDM